MGPRLRGKRYLPHTLPDKRLSSTSSHADAKVSNKSKAFASRSGPISIGAGHSGWCFLYHQRVDSTAVEILTPKKGNR